MSLQVYDEMAAAGTPIGVHLQSTQAASIERLWARACAPEGSAARAGLPARCDRRWFLETFCGGDDAEAGATIWPLIRTFNMYDSLALVAAVPSLAHTHFHFTEHDVQAASRYTLAHHDAPLRHRLPHRLFTPSVHTPCRA